MISSELNSATLRFLADMVRVPELPVDVAKHGDVITIPAPPNPFFFPGGLNLTAVQRRAMSSARTQGLVSRDELHPSEHLLRIGWGWVAGPVEIDGRLRRVLAPLVTVPVRKANRVVAALTEGGDSGLGGGWVREGDVEGSHLIADVGLRAQIAEDAQLAEMDSLEDDAWWQQFPAVGAWLSAGAEAMGFPTAEVRSPDEGLRDLRSGKALTVTPMLGLFLARDMQQYGRRPSLLAWADRGDSDGTAFASLYLGVDDAEPPRDGHVSASILPLDSDQTRAVVRARANPVSVVSGPPGTGKSHTVAAIAVDAVNRGERVLIATQSQHASSVIIDFLIESGAPAPVVFGDNRSREEMVAHLAHTIGERTDDANRSASELEEAVQAVERSRKDVLALLAAENAHFGVDPVAGVLGSELSDAEWGQVENDLSIIDGRRPAGWWTRRRARSRVMRHGGPQRVAALKAGVGARRLRRAGGLSLADAVDEQVALDAELRRRFVALVEAQAADRLGRAGRTAVTNLSRALRSGRGARRAMLADMDGAALLDALPLWVGTIGDIDDLLPPTVAMFDLVVVDEASQVDQTVAPPALLRGGRIVAAGDPHQLRHTSFTADAAMAGGLESHGISDTPRAALLDVRRNSLLDVASAAGVTTTLTTHYRSVPHLIDFSADRFYDGRVAPATRHPSVDTSDRIDIVQVSGRRAEGGENVAEVEAVIDLLRAAVETGERDIGVVTPFRAQADRLEDRIVETFDTAAIVDHRIAVGTVHSFQGAERDHVVISLALDDDSSSGSFRFVENRHLFNVMVTRARQRCTVVTSLNGDRPGMITDYLDHAAAPGETVRDQVVGGWSADVAGYLADQGVEVRTGYPVGHETLELVVGPSHQAYAIDTRVHVDGPDAHLRRRLMLASLGWEVVDAFESRWGSHGPQLAIQLAQGGRPTDPGG